MLDATAIADPDDFSPEDFRDKGLVIRRFKKDIQAQVRETFRDREIIRRRFPASPEEEAAFEALLAVKVAGTVAEGTMAEGTVTTAAPADTDTGTGMVRRDLFLVTLEKALFSSPAACIASIDQRIRRRERELARGPGGPAATAPNHPPAAEVESLRVLRAALERIGPEGYGKYRALLRAIRGGEPFTWNPRNARDRLVVFTERIETLRWLRERLREDLHLGPGQIAILHGGMSDVDQQRVVEDFGNAARPVRLLLCSDVASEGINLHYHCHRLIHFDMPWSLMVFQQRNGRVDRYGQERTPRIVYLVTESANETIRGDTRILEVLERKDEQAYRDIGDPSAFMNVHDVQAEEDVTRRAVAGGEGAERFRAGLQRGRGPARPVPRHGGGGGRRGRERRGPRERRRRQERQQRRGQRGRSERRGRDGRAAAPVLLAPALPLRERPRLLRSGPAPPPGEEPRAALRDGRRRPHPHPGRPGGPAPLLRLLPKWSRSTGVSSSRPTRAA